MSTFPIKKKTSFFFIYNNEFFSISFKLNRKSFPYFLSSSLAFVAHWLPPYFLPFIVPVGLFATISCHASPLGFISFFFLFSLVFYGPFVFILLYFYLFFIIFCLLLGISVVGPFFSKMGINKRISNGLRDYTKCTPTKHRDFHALAQFCA